MRLGTHLVENQQGCRESFVDSDGAASFRKGPKAYDQLIGRYSPALGRSLIGFAGVAAGQRVLDVGCGTGLLTAELAAVVGADSVSALDPSEAFVWATADRVPGAEIRVGAAEQIPFDDEDFDAALAQLVVNFMADAPAGVQEMRRVVHPGGVVAACVWDYKGQMRLLRSFWDAAFAAERGSNRLDEGVRMGFSDPASLSALWSEQQLRDVVTAELRPVVRYADFDELWRPFLAGVAPTGVYVASLDEAGRAALRDEFFRRLGSPVGPFELTARAWAVVGRR